MKKSTYKGYQAYSYLTAGEDYPIFKFSKWDRFGRYKIELSAAQNEEVERLAEEKLFIALHEHPVYFPDDVFETPDYNRAGRQFTAYDALAESYIDCVFDNMIDGMSNMHSQSGWKWSEVIHDLGMRLCDIAHQDFLVHCKTVDDILEAKAAGKIGWVAVVEGAAPIENELDRIDVLYGLGVRQLGITYSQANSLGCGVKEDNDSGLTQFGRAAVKRMNKVGMLLDVSHCGPQTALDVIELSNEPIIVSHVGARALWDIKRLASDYTIKAAAEKGGVIAIESAPHTTMTHTHKTHDIDSVMEHFEYVANLVGIDHVSFGIDSLYGNHVGLHDVFSSRFTSKDKAGKPSHEKVDYVRGLENPTEASWNVLRWLVKKGYSDSDIEKVLGGNALRVLRQVWK